MFESFEYRGQWWVPGELEIRVLGTLKFNPFDGGRLYIEGEDFSQIEAFFALIREQLKNSNCSQIILLGRSLDPIPFIDFTLLGCSCLFINTLDLIPNVIYVEYIFSGFHFEDPTEIKFKDLSIQYTHLFEWINFEVFEIEPLSSREKVIKLSPSEPLEIEVNDDFNLLIGLARKEFIARKEISIKVEGEIMIVPREEKGFKEYYLDIIKKLERFIALAVDERIYPISLKGTTLLNKRFFHTEVLYPSISIYYKVDSFGINKNLQVLSPTEVLFTLKNITKEKLRESLHIWFKNFDFLGPICELYFESVNSKISLRYRFLMLMQAIEAYHRCKYKSYYLSDEKFRMIQEKLGECIETVIKDNISSNEKIKRRLEDRLKYGNEFSLRDRLKELLEDYKIFLPFNSKERKKFIERVIEVRNSLVHYSFESSEKISDEEINLLFQKLKILLQAILLREVRVEEFLLRSLSRVC